MFVKLPFLQESKWPTSREPEERVVNPSPDKQVQDHLMDELMVAFEKRDARRIRESLVSLVHAIRSEGME